MFNPAFVAFISRAIPVIINISKGAANGAMWGAIGVLIAMMIS